MAIIFVFTDDEEARAKALGVNYMHLKDTSIESLEKMINDPFVLIFMPFLKSKKEIEEIRANFKNQVAMREIWKA